METMDYDLLDDLGPGGGDVIADTAPLVPDVQPNAERAVVAPTSTDLLPDAPSLPTHTAPPVAEEAPLDAVEYSQLTPREQALIKRLEQITGERLDLRTVPVEAAPAPPEAAPAHNFMEGRDLDDVLATPENFNAFLTEVHQRTLTQASQLAAETILKNLPQVISQYVTQHITMTERVKQFYDDNRELAQVKRTVASVANEISAENPALTLDEVFDEAASRTYKMLGIKKAAQGAVPATNGAKRPALVTPRNPGGRVKVPALQGLVAEVADLMDI